MSMPGPSNKELKPPTPKRLRQSIRFDTVNPSDYLKYRFPICCEECTHFNSETGACTIGYEPKWHRRDFQIKSCELSGKIALCRFMEID
jgi:hypothetical protein